MWFDTNEIEGSDDWVREIENGVDTSSIMVVVWTENSANSDWVGREIARADDQKKPIIPLMFDDTKINSILLQRIQYLDFRQGYHSKFQELVSVLIRLLENGQRSLPQNAGLAWQPVKHPFYRSRFLEENNYLDRRSSNFAVNNRTKNLVNYLGQNANAFMSIVSVPIPEPFNLDFDTLPDLLKRYLNNSRPMENSLAEWQRFNFDELRNRNTSQSDYILYEPYREGKTENKLGSRVYTCFHEDGAIEFAMGDYVVQEVNPQYHSGFAFYLINILGIAWKFVNLSSDFYALLGYHNKFQM